MSDSELYLDEPFPERAEAPNRVERALKWSVVALSAALVVELAWFLLVVMPLFLNPLLADLARLRAQAPALLDSISEIRVVKRSFDGYELVLYPAYRSVRVRIGSQLNEDVLRYMMLLLDVLASKGIDTDELDFRTGTAAYRTKEG